MESSKGLSSEDVVKRMETSTAEHAEKTRFSRQYRPWSTVLAAFVVLLSAGGLRAGRGPSDAPIIIGFLAPLSGPYVQNGRDILNGFLLALDEIGYRAGGRPVEVIVKTTKRSRPWG